MGTWASDIHMPTCSATQICHFCRLMYLLFLSMPVIVTSQLSVVNHFSLLNFLFVQQNGLVCDMSLSTCILYVSEQHICKGRYMQIYIL